MLAIDFVGYSSWFIVQNEAVRPLFRGGDVRGHFYKDRPIGYLLLFFMNTDWYY